MSIETFLFKKVYDNLIAPKCTPVPGSVVYCDLVGCAEHSGIYVGNNKIVHLDGSGKIEQVSPNTFLKRLNGFNPAFKIYVSCHDKSAAGLKEVAARALDMVGSERDYNLILDNCHQFSSGCLTGDFSNADNFLWMLKYTAEKSIRANKWRIWDL